MCVRSSITFYGNFNLDMGRSPGFGSAFSDYDALLRLGFPSASVFPTLTSPLHATRRTVLQKVRGCTLHRTSTVCKHRVSGSLSLPSRGPFHLSFTVLCAIGHWVVFSLTGWSPLLPTRFPVSRGTLDLVCSVKISRTRLSLSSARFSKPLLLSARSRVTIRTPECSHSGLGSFPFARRYSGNRCFFLFLRVLRCFSSPGSPP